MPKSGRYRDTFSYFYNKKYESLLHKAYLLYFIRLKGFLLVALCQIST